ncbi:MAG: hypothetical protein EOO63_06590 [Hymenobacter sp.]|nr:MAG: hypothetical protein EOO63_06590 [Hymenobacter sp.]
MLRLLLCFWLLNPLTTCYGQLFHWPASYAVQVPRTVFLQIKEQVQVKGRWGVAPERFTYLPVYNVLQPKQRAFTDGIYYNVGSIHDSGRLFIYRNGMLTFLRGSSTKALLADYITYLRHNSLPEETQVEYLSDIPNFLKFLQ